MGIFFAKLNKNSKGPDLPPNNGFLLLAGCDEILKTGIYEVHLIDHDSKKSYNISGFTEISLELYSIIQSAKGYPPALALARDEIKNKYSNTNNVPYKEFEIVYKRLLVNHLNNQRNSNYLMAESIIDNIYHPKGSYFWILEYSPKYKQVKWVSDDYVVYIDSASVFKLSHTDIERLSSHTKSKTSI